MDVVARMHGGGVSAQAGALRHGISPRAARGRPEPARRAQAPRLPDARPARQGAQEGRPQEGPQAAAVLQALAPCCEDGRAEPSPSPCPAKLFGTDGVRGVAGELLTADLALGARPRRDDRRAIAAPSTRACSSSATRASRARCSRPRSRAGVAAAGGEVLLGGVLPTPAAPLLLAPLRVRPRRGHLARRTTRTATTASSSSAPTASSSPTRPRRRSRRGSSAPAGGRRRASAASARCTAPQEDYLRALHERFADLDLTRRCTSLLDCANGATYRVAPEIFRRLGATVTVVDDAPGRAQHQRRLRLDPRRRARRDGRDGGHDVGFAFDGDGDRVLAVDRDGAVVDGDELIALAALHLRARRPPARRRRRRDRDDELRLPRGDGDGRASRSRRTQVGDRYVLEALRERGWALGGEQSGHIIDLGFAPSGDGIASALLTLEALAGRRPRASATRCSKLPQRLVNVRVADRDAAMAAAELDAPRARRRAPRSPAAAACSSARAAPSRSCA